MLVQIHTNGKSRERENLVEQVETEVTEALSHYANQITRLEIHIDDENSHKGGENDKRCTIEARIENRTPTAVTNHASTIDEAVTGAADKMKRALDSTIGKLRDARQSGSGTEDPAVNLVGGDDEEEATA